ncbi:hypothetical protein TIFTF001_017916 [Ficus carica]|uniref:R3H-associated N-terminal domain-containing protein n=1 Tax=Ficus carica TaxID=3494 RepID=A0AA88ABJ2_FICCA|nr:hypothetical protein TIFTF001_017916 [Ficus carica]
MATTDVLQREDDLFLSSSLLDPRKGENAKSREMSIEKKIEFLESLAGKVSNRRSRRWLNDRLLMELVPRLNAEEIRGLFAPPPWGDDVPPSAFSMTNVGEWDKFRNIDMDREANIMDALKSSPSKRKGRVDSDKMAVLNAWRRVDCRTREALRRSSLLELIEGYEECIRAYITDSREEEALVLQFYNLGSVTVKQSGVSKSSKTTRITRKKRGSVEIPSISLSHFLRMSKEGVW